MIKQILQTSYAHKLVFYRYYIKKLKFVLCNSENWQFLQFGNYTKNL